MWFRSARLRIAFRALVLASGTLLATGGTSALGAPQTQTVVKVFTFKYRRVEDALAVLRPLLSDLGAVSVVLETNLNSLTVRGTPSRVEQITRAVAAFDVPLRAIDIAVTLLKSASEKSRAAEKTNVSEEIRDRKSTRLNS